MRVGWTIAGTALAAIAQLLPAAAAASGPAVIITVDVESTETLALPKQVDAVCSGKIPCGLNHIQSMLRHSGYPATYFLNVYEYKSWGEDELRSIARELSSGGNDVALHTHPQWAYDRNRPYMYSYDLAEQTRIISDGKRLLEAWTGTPVTSHRGGAYSADRNTIVALARHGIHVDSSLFFGQPNSRLNGLGLPRNLPSIIDGVTEIPVTVYDRLQTSQAFPSLLPVVPAIGKIDVDSIQTPQEAAAAIQAVTQAHIPYIILFLHSYSFIDAPKGHAGTLRADTTSIAVFQAMLDAIRDQGLRVVTMRDVADSLPIQTGTARDALPKVTVPVPELRYLARLWRSWTPARQLATVVAAACLALLGIFMFVWRAGATRQRGATGRA